MSSKPSIPRTLGFAVWSDNVALVRELLDAGADVSKRDNTGRTALHYAVGAGGLAVEVLLAAGSEVNAADDGGGTPLHEAIVRGNVSAIEALCHGGAHCSARDRTGRTPADLLFENKDVFTSDELAAVNLLLVST